MDLEITSRNKDYASGTELLFLTPFSSERRSPWGNELQQRIYKLRLEHLVLPEGKEVVKKIFLINNNNKEGVCQRDAGAN